MYGHGLGWREFISQPSPQALKPIGRPSQPVGRNLPFSRAFRDKAVDEAHMIPDLKAFRTCGKALGLEQVLGFGDEFVIALAVEEFDRTNPAVFHKKASHQRDPSRL